MLNDTTALSMAFSGVMSEKGNSSLKKFKARIKHMIDTIDFDEPTDAQTLVWDKVKKKG